MSDEQPVVFDDDNPEWTVEDFSRAKPLDAFPELAVALVRGKARRPLDAGKTQISLRVDRDVLERFRATGRGWQTRMNEALRRAMP